MKEWPGEMVELVTAVAQARREARDSGPRGSNDDLEAAIYVASAFAMQRVFDARAAAQEAETIAPEPPPDEPVVTTEEHEATEEAHALTDEEEHTEEDHPHRKGRKRKTADDD